MWRRPPRGPRNPRPHAGCPERRALGISFPAPDGRQLPPAPLPEGRRCPGRGVWEPQALPPATLLAGRAAAQLRGRRLTAVARFRRSGACLPPPSRQAPGSCRLPGSPGAGPGPASGDRRAGPRARGPRGDLRPSRSGGAGPRRFAPCGAHVGLPGVGLRRGPDTARSGPPPAAGTARRLRSGLGAGGLTSPQLWFPSQESKTQSPRPFARCATSAEEF